MLQAVRMSEQGADPLQFWAPRKETLSFALCPLVTDYRFDYLQSDDTITF